MKLESTRLSMITKQNSDGKKAKKKKQENGIDESDGLTDEQIEGDFSKFDISEATIQKLKAHGINYLFPIQYKTFNSVSEGYDVIAQARTGTGKTLSFVLPIVEKLQKRKRFKDKGQHPLVIALAPTRELARQVNEDFKQVTGDLSSVCIYGGVPYEPQENALRRGLDILVGTPGRILDLIQKGTLVLDKIRHVILDEVDQMLDLGFAESVDEILKAAYEIEDKKPQTLLFSATLPPWVYKTAQKYMSKDVKKVDLIGTQTIRTATTVQHLAIKCNLTDREATICDVVSVYSGNHGRAIVFCQTKKEADQLSASHSMKLDAHVLHGDIPQDKRELVLNGFRGGKYKVLITTDVAARGLDIPQIDLVVQCSPPKDVESYIHRSGRTGRAGRSGQCLCFYTPRQESDLIFVERRAGIVFKRIGAPTTTDIVEAAARDAARSLDNVLDETLEHFRESASALIAERGAENALAAALAVISKSTKIVSRSLLSSKEGFITYIFRTNIEMRGPSYFFRALEKQLPEVSQRIGVYKLCKDKLGYAFDVPVALENNIELKWLDTQYDTLQKADGLPELMAEMPLSNRRGSFGGGRGRDRGFRGGGGGYRGGRNWQSAGPNRFGAKRFGDIPRGPPNKRFKRE